MGGRLLFAVRVIDHHLIEAFERGGKPPRVGRGSKDDRPFVSLSSGSVSHLGKDEQLLRLTVHVAHLSGDRQQ